MDPHLKKKLNRNATKRGLIDLYEVPQNVQRKRLPRVLSLIPDNLCMSILFGKNGGHIVMDQTYFGCHILDLYLLQI